MTTRIDIEGFKDGKVDKNIILPSRVVFKKGTSLEQIDQSSSIK